MPVSTTVPASAFISLLPPSVMTPETVRLAPLAAPIAVPSSFRATVPLSVEPTPPTSAPALPTPSPEIVRFSATVMLSAIFSVAPLLTVVAPPVVPSAVACPATSVPVDTVVAPV